MKLFGVNSTVQCLYKRHKPLNSRRIIVGEEQAVSCIQRLDLFHLLIGQGEVKDIKVFFHTVLVCGLRDQHYIALKKETKRCLGNRLIVFFTDLFQYRIVEIVVLALCKRSP